MNPLLIHLDNWGWTNTRHHENKKVTTNNPLESVIQQRLEMHKVNLMAWREPDGPAIPTEPDPEERDRVRDRLKTAINELQEVLK